MARRSPSMQDLLHEGSSFAVVLVATALWVMLRQVCCPKSARGSTSLMPARPPWCLPDRGLHALLLSTVNQMLWLYVQVLQTLRVIISEALRTAQLVSLPLLSVAQVSSPDASRMEHHATTQDVTSLHVSTSSLMVINHNQPCLMCACRHGAASARARTACQAA